MVPGDTDSFSLVVGAQMRTWGRSKRQRIAIRRKQHLKEFAPYALAVAGARAFREGKSVEACPYPEDAPARKGWTAGWIMARDRKVERERERRQRSIRPD